MEKIGVDDSGRAVKVDAQAVVESVKRVLQTESLAILDLIETLNGNDWAEAVRVILQCHGRVVVSGIGKSGHIARKLAATLASTGTPAFFVHPAEASHGDFGMITAEDVFVALSNSGRTEELLSLLPLLHRLGVTIISLTGQPESPLAKAADVHLDGTVRREACPLNLAPTASTTAALALGDALAIAVLEARGFTPEDFARTHPGGALGRRLLTRVSDVMHPIESAPHVLPTTPLRQTLLEITEKRLGMAVVVDEQQVVLGVFTDGDLRRVLSHKVDFDRTTVGEVMHVKPYTIRAHEPAGVAVQVMQNYRINQLIVVDDGQHLVGALNMHDLLVAKVI